MTVSLTRLVGEYLYTQRIEDVKRQALAFAQEAEAEVAGQDAEALFSRMLERSALLGKRILVTDPYGAVLSDSGTFLSGTRLSSPEVAAALSAGVESGTCYQATGSDGQQTIICLSACPIREGETILGAAVLLEEARDLYESLRRVQLRMYLTLIAVALVVITITLWITHRVTKPVNVMNGVISEMAGGNLSVRVPVKGHNEFAQLAQSFNTMCERLELLDKSRSQFVSNASHELKTPLSTMKILIETMLYQDPMDPAMTKEFLSDINKEIDRLSSIIGDLLTLVKMDDEEVELERENVPLGDLLGDNVKRLAPLARERGIEMTLTVKEAITVPGDAGRLTQVFYNLIDNAVKYTPRGGRVRVELARSGRKAVVKVADTGIGIPKEDQAHIFERFYRVDKARSRETGGTGLGLSIVSQIVKLHGGTVSLASEEEKGSTFTVELPMNAA